MNVEKVEQPKLAQHDSSVLDLAFCMDCTGSMSSYIINARNSIRHIVEEIVASEKSDVRLALVEYRDHPPQDRTFVTKVHDFTGSIKEMKTWLDKCSANGGGDGPEAVADGLHDVLKLSWREKSTKICVLISDAPPHGLDPSGDTMPNGCACNIDPIEVVRQMGEKGITLYSVGCEPAIIRYKEFFEAIAYKTGGQYVPLRNANLLSKVIIGGAQEEISLEKLMEDVQAEVRAQVNLAGGVVNEARLTEAVHQKLQSQGALTKNLKLNNSNLEGASTFAKNFSKLSSLQNVQQQYIALQPQIQQQQLQKQQQQMQQQKPLFMQPQMQPQMQQQPQLRMQPQMQPQMQQQSMFSQPQMQQQQQQQQQPPFMFGAAPQPFVTQSIQPPIPPSTSLFRAAPQASFSFGMQPPIQTQSIFNPVQMQQQSMQMVPPTGMIQQPLMVPTSDIFQPMPPTSDTFTVDTELINKEQTERLVQKALNRSNLNNP